MRFPFAKPTGALCAEFRNLMSHRAEDLIRQLGRRFGVVLAIVSALLVLDQAALQPLLLRLNSSAPTINAAGRQRMLSQRIVKDSLLVASGATPGEALSTNLTNHLESWRAMHAALLNGDAALNIEQTSNPLIREQLTAMTASVDALTHAVTDILAEPAAARASLPALLAAEQDYLPRMDGVVRLFEQDAQARIRALRNAALAATALVIALIIGLQWIVLRPAITLIRRQVNELEEHEQLLEHRVRERTSELELAAGRRDAAERRTLELQSQLAHAARVHSLGELATGIAHEVNQPLGAISNHAETLLILVQQQPLDTTALERTATQLRNAANRAGQIIRRMRNFVRARPEVRSPELVNNLIREAVSLCDHELRSAGIRPELDLGETHEVNVLADGIQLQQVLVNLIRNSLQAFDGHPVARRSIRIATTRRDAEFEIHLDDNGPGFSSNAAIPPNPLESTKPEGMGLGLSISRSIVAAHGGEMHLSNAPGGGASVTLVLPILQPTSPLEPADRLCC